MNDNDGKGYIKTLVYVFIMFGAFILAIMSAYFGIVGLYFGQGIVEVDVFEDKYKYECAGTIQSNGTCTTGFNTSNELTSWTDYQADRTQMNDLISRFLVATFVVFSLLGLVFLFLALKSAGLVKGKGSSKKDDMW